MSVKALTWATEQVTGAPLRKLLLMLLADYSDPHGLCWPGQSTLAKRSECSRLTVLRALQAMESDGLVKRYKRGGENGGRSTDLFALQMPGILEMQKRILRRRARGVKYQSDTGELCINGDTAIRTVSSRFSTRVSKGLQGKRLEEDTYTRAGTVDDEVPQ